MAQRLLLNDDGRHDGLGGVSTIKSIERLRIRITRFGSCATRRSHPLQQGLGERYEVEERALHGVSVDGTKYRGHGEKECEGGEERDKRGAVIRWR